MAIIKPDTLIVRPEEVVRIARSYIGKEELPNNSGFKDPEFQKKMSAMGWLKGQSWCVYTSELIWKEAFTPEHPYYKLLDLYFSGSATATWANFKAAPQFKTGKMPKPGALALWQYGKTWKGHAGVVVPEIKGKLFKSVEGNTNRAGSREGIVIAEKQRNAGALFSNTGLNLLGFVYLPE